MEKEEFLQKFKEDRNAVIETVCAELLYEMYIRCLAGTGDISEAINFALALIKGKINSSL